MHAGGIKRAIDMEILKRQPGMKKIQRKDYRKLK